jgi:CubicO group peptidase (beta-lactamase class C family)
VRPRILFLSLLILAAAPSTVHAAGAAEPAGLHQALNQLALQEKFSGAVVVRGAEGVRFARGYGWADPFERRRFTAETPADSGSLAKPVTSAAVLLLVSDGKIELDAPVKRYLPEYPNATATVRHLLSHSAGLELKDSPDVLANKSNAQLLAETGAPRFPPGSAFTYCNLCSVTLALLIERVAGTHYLEFVKRRLAVPTDVRLRPQRLADWIGRAIGYRRTSDGKNERFDSWDGELLYGAANLSISASQLAIWGSQWWQSRLAPIRPVATTPARIGDHRSGLTLGNWYCGTAGRRCHYLGHHEGFHHMLYWDADRRISVAMLTNNAIAPGLQQRLQRALVAFAEAQPTRARDELASPMRDIDVPVGSFELLSGELVEVVAHGQRRSVRRGGLDYPAYLIGSGIRYVPGLDLYIAGAPDGRLQWLTLYESHEGQPRHASRR